VEFIKRDKPFLTSSAGTGVSVDRRDRTGVGMFWIRLRGPRYARRAIPERALRSS
jgi:hypothetical protein